MEEIFERNSSLSSWQSAGEYFQGKWDGVLGVTGKDNLPSFLAFEVNPN